MPYSPLTTDQVADTLIARVRAAPAGGGTGDTAQLVMVGAYLRGFQRFKWIRALASEGAGDEAMILARSLLSLTARATYVDHPPDPAARRRRFDQYHLRHLRDRLSQIEGLAAARFDVSDLDVDDIRKDIAELEARAPGGFPNDRDLFELLTLDPFYQRLYRLGSDHMHFSLGVAVADLRDVETVNLEAGDAQIAAEALSLATVTYLLLLHVSERAVGHGLSAGLPALVDAWREGQDRGEGVGTGVGTA